MTTRIRRWERAPGGFYVDVEIVGAYTDGSGRMERVWVAREEVRGKTPGEKRQAVFDALGDAPLDGIEDALVQQPTQTKDILEARMIALYEKWQRWKTTRVEAEARGVPGAVLTSLVNKENAVWDNYADAVLEWRSAPAS